MRRRPGRPGRSAVGAALLVAAFGATGCGGGDGATEPDTAVASVVITTAAPTFGALGRTVQFAAQARDAAGAPLAGRSFTWSSSNGAVASVSTSGLVTAVANGTAQVTASTAGKLSAGVTVTVSQVPNELAVSPTSVTFGAIGSTRQLAATVRDSTSNVISGVGVAFTRAGTGTTATVSATGLVTATGNGAADTAVATSGSLSARVPIAVAQVVASVTVASAAGTAPDTLFTTGRTRQFTAAAADSNGNAIAGSMFAWSSSTTTVATVNASTGLATAAGDGTTQIRATASGVTGSRNLVVRRFAATFTRSPASASITTQSGTQTFTGTAQDSAGTSLAISWLSRNTAVATVSPAGGASTTATATGNGSTFIVMSGGTRADSASLAVSNQAAAVSFANDVQPIFTTNCAIGGCHAGANPDGGLNLSAGQARGNIVGVASATGPGEPRVIASNAENSFLVKKLEGRQGNCGSTMPQGAAPLSSTQIQTIRNWINQGAANN